MRTVTTSDPAIPPLHLADLTWIEARAALGPDCIIMLPVGAIEAHGPHLPLDTDVIIAVETSRRAAIRLRARDRLALIAPPITYGVSYVGAPFAGTVPAPSAAVSALVENVITGLATFGPTRFAVVNAHLEPAHVESIRHGIGRAAANTGVTIAFPDKREPRWAAALSEEFRRGSRHAGAYETSLLLAAAPHKVRTDLLSSLPPVIVDLPSRLRAGARTFADAGGTDAYFGDPARATAAEGERLFDALASMIETAVDELDLTPPLRLP
ncbi:MAG: creatinine amidohydrolase [Thermomicrobiales bacterium]|nr:creatinine amidohydrolase [Thermomicrobiales bacterium]